MTNKLHQRLLGPVMLWTVLTTLFTWLPLVRIIGRPEGYNWQILGLGGEGLDGPYWIFLPFTIYSVLLLYTGERGPRSLFRPMLVLWHLFVLGIVVAALVTAGNNAAWQGQGLYWKVPMWVAAVPTVIFTFLAVIWVIIDRQQAEHRVGAWTRVNTIRLASSLALLVVALGLFRAGTNYNWVTATAIVTTILHWVALSWSFADANKTARARHSDPKPAPEQ